MNNYPTETTENSINTFKLTLILLVLGLGLWAIVWGVNKWIKHSEWNRLKHIEVIGTKRLSERDIINAANIKLNVKLSDIQLDSIARRVERIPAVFKSRVFRRIPGKLIIKIVEREPIAMIVHRNLELVDENGVLFPIIKTGETLDLPVITINTSGVNQENVNKGFKRAVNFIALLKRNYKNIYEHISEISCCGTHLEMRLRENGALVKALNPEDELTLIKLEHFLIQRSCDLAHKPTYIDLRYPNLVILKSDG